MTHIEIKKNLQDKNIRRVYRQLCPEMPPELEKQLVDTGCILWEEFTRTAVNKFDIKGIMSQQLGFFETGLCVLPPVGSLYQVKEIEGGLGGIFSNQLDLTQLYVAIEQANVRPSDIKNSVYELGAELSTLQMVIN